MIVASLMLVSPVMMRPSAAIRSPGRTRMWSPFFSSDTRTVWPLISSAEGGVRVISFSTDSRAPAAVCCSIRLASIMKKAMMPPSW